MVLARHAVLWVKHALDTFLHASRKNVTHGMVQVRIHCSHVDYCTYPGLSHVTVLAGGGVCSALPSARRGVLRVQPLHRAGSLILVLRYITVPQCSLSYPRGADTSTCVGRRWHLLRVACGQTGCSAGSAPASSRCSALLRHWHAMASGGLARWSACCATTMFVHYSFGTCLLDLVCRCSSSSINYFCTITKASRHLKPLLV
jgi:hypothetical protein